MGIDFTAVMDHRLDPDALHALPERLNEVWTLPAPLERWIAAYVRPGTTGWAWIRSAEYGDARAEHLAEGTMTLEGPHGFHGRLYPGGIELVHLARWRSFLTETDFRLGLVEASRLVAAQVHAGQVVYLPDSGFPPAGAFDLLVEGKSVAEVVDWLRATVGPPRELHALQPETEPMDPAIWFYDRRAEPSGPGALRR